LNLAHPVSAQHHYSLLTREIENDVLEVTRRFGLGVIPYYPLESGFLTGKYRPATTPAGARLSSGPRAEKVLSDQNFERLEKLEQFATGRGHTLLQLALGWLLSKPEVATVIAGASSGEQVRKNVEASGWRLDAAELAEVDAI
ncbi:MAG TPA: aldo/keto reductase, partial [Myxococcaceae bacterium]|nr:aldo/keto reductase [Myxococcaceae bacterium]